MIKTTKVNDTLRQFQFDLNQYVWGPDGLNINAVFSDTDDVFTKVKPVLKKLATPIYIYFSIDINPQNITNSYSKIKKVFDFVNTISDYTTSGVYNVAPIIQYALFKQNDTLLSAYTSDPYLYYTKAIKLSGRETTFRYRDIILDQIREVITEDEIAVKSPMEYGVTNSTLYYTKTEVYSFINSNALIANTLFYDIKSIQNSSSNFLFDENKRNVRSKVSNKQFELKVYLSQLNILYDLIDKLEIIGWKIYDLLPTKDTFTQDVSKPFHYFKEKLGLILLTRLDPTLGLTNISDLKSELQTAVFNVSSENAARNIKTSFFNNSFPVIEELLDVINEISSKITELNKTDDIRDQDLSLFTSLFKGFNYKSINFFIRLYPRAGQIAYPNMKINTGTVSDNRLLTINNGATNLECSLQGNLALNTLDAQWLDLYTNIFDFMTTMNLSRGFTLRFGNYSIPNCYFKTAPRFINNGQSLSLFNLDIVSSVRKIDDINVLSYGKETEVS